MKRMSTDCPEDTALETLVKGECSEDDRELLEGHLEDCEVCQVRLSGLSSDEGWKKLMPADQLIQIDTREPDTAAQKFVSSSPDAIPEIEGYTIDRSIGRGGMGTVYRARQHSLNRIVALKVLGSSAIENPKRWLRFKTEVEAIGRLQHAHIVQVFDSGEQEGVAFVSQELCEENSLEDRLNGPQPAARVAAMLQQLATAVEHAHQQNVLHRDIKPSNILFDGDTVKLADFGLAKLTDADENMTRTQDVMGTPSYMSPEQSRADHDTIGPQTDVFQLGVLLYELLTGSVPFVADTAVETLRLVQEHDPVRPTRIVPSVPADLETICLKCLEKNIGQRYATAEALALDLDRFLQGRPIQAKRPTLFHRFRKWAGREPRLAILSGTVLATVATLAALWFSFTAQLSSVNADLIRTNGQLELANNSLESETNRANEKATLAEQRLELATENRRIADAVNQFLQQDLLGQSAAAAQLDWLAAVGQSASNFTRNPTVRELLQRVKEKLERPDVFPDEPQIKAELLLTIGTAWHNLGDYESAIGSLAEASELFEKLSFPDSHIRCLRQLAASEIADGQHEFAQATYERCLELSISHTGSESVQSLMLVMEKANCSLYVTYLPTVMMAAADEAKGALESLRQILPDNAPELIRATSLLGHMLGACERFDESLPLLETVAEVAEFTLGPQHPSTLAAQYELAVSCEQNLQYERAADISEKIWTTAKLVLGKDHPTTLSYQFRAARGKREQRKPNESVTLAKEAYSAMSQHFPEAHPLMMESLEQLAAAHAFAGDYESAIDAVRKKAEIAKRKWGNESQSAVIADVLTARYMASSGQSRESLDILADVFERKNARVKLPLLFMEMQRDYAKALVADGQLELAGTVIQKTYDEHVQHFGIESEATFETGLILINVLRQQQKYSEVVEVTQQLIEDASGRLPPEERTLLVLRQLVVNTHLQLGNHAEASTAALENARIYMKKFPDDPAGYFYLSQHAYCQYFLKDLDSARKTAREAWDGLEKTTKGAKPDSTHSGWRLQTARMLKAIHEALNDDEQTKHWQSIAESLEKPTVQE